MLTFIKNATLLTPLCRRSGVIVIQDRQIEAIEDHVEIPDGATVIDDQGLYAAPGFVDLHVHGGGGYGVMDCNSQEIIRMCQAHAQHGVTSILPTTLASPISHLQRAIEAVRQAKEEYPGILGIHLEGPFLSPSQKGAQNEDSILPATQENVRALLDTWDGIRMMGAAPEAVGGLALADTLREAGIVPSIAHSDADYDTVVKAIEHGYTDVTHIYSSCSSVIRKNGYRVPGVVEAGLLQDELTVQIIADGRHLPTALLRLIVKCKGPDKISLISDGLEYSASQIQEGTVYRQANGVETIYEDQVMKLLDRQAFAGSTASGDRLVRTMVEVGVSLQDAITMASTTPARVIGEDRRKGRLAPGYDADLVLFDGFISIKLTMGLGQILYSELGAEA